MTLVVLVIGAFWRLIPEDGMGPPHHWPNSIPTKNDDSALNVDLVLYTVRYSWWHVDQRFSGLPAPLARFVMGIKKPRLRRGLDVNP